MKLNEASGASWITIRSETGLLWMLPPATEEWDSMTSKLPAFAKVCVGEGRFEKLPSPKFQRKIPLLGRFSTANSTVVPGQPSVTLGLMPISSRPGAVGLVPAVGTSAEEEGSVDAPGFTSFAVDRVGRATRSICFVALRVLIASLSLTWPSEAGWVAVFSFRTTGGGEVGLCFR